MRARKNRTSAACAALLVPFIYLIVAAAAPALAATWPPKLGQAYPDLELPDHTGRKVKLSTLKGKVLLIEPVGIPCAACQAFAGGHELGGFGRVSPQPGLKSIEDYVEEYAGPGVWNNPDLRLVQILFYSLSMKAPTMAETAAWAKHFGLDKRENVVVLAGAPEMISQGTYALIPGFQLVDRDFILRFDSTGHRPRHDLWRELIPGLKRMLLPLPSGTR